MTDEMTRQVLRRVPLFRELPAEAIELIARRAVTRHVSKNTLLFREGEPCRGLYVIMDGSIRIYRSTADGHEQTLMVEGPKKTLAELTLFDESPYPASAQAAEDSTVLFLLLRDFQQLYHENPDIADALIRELGRRLKRLVQLVARITLKNVPARVASALLEEAEAAGAARDGGTFGLPFTQEELARELSTTRESVSRALAALRADGVVARAGAGLRILSVARLQAAAGADASLVSAVLYASTLPAAGDAL
jgi:CRP/FNR family transcriptional regulator, cyclic AMP receptor protein